jgi:hypothetical protein
MYITLEELLDIFMFIIALATLIILIIDQNKKK